MSSHLQRHVGKCGVSVTSPLLLFFVLLFPLCTCVKAQKKQQSTLYTRKRDPSSSSLAFSTNQTRKEKRTREEIVWQLASLPLFFPTSFRCCCHSWESLRFIFPEAFLLAFWETWLCAGEDPASVCVNVCVLSRAQCCSAKQNSFWLRCGPFFPGTEARLLGRQVLRCPSYASFRGPLPLSFPYAHLLARDRKGNFHQKYFYFSTK